MFVPLPGVPEEAKNQCEFAPCEGRRPPHDRIQLPHGRERPLPLAVLRPVRRRLPQRPGRPDADAGLHGRVPECRLTRRSPSERLPGTEPRTALHDDLDPRLADRHAAGDLPARPDHAARPRQRTGLGEGHRQHRAARHGDARAAAGRDLPRVLHHRLPPAARAARWKGRPSAATRDCRRPGSWSPRCWCSRWPPTGPCGLRAGYGAGSGSGPKPLTVPKGPKLPVQVIAQQWMFTYRYPTYGGVETPHLVLPDNEMIELHVTSIDVIHSFWAYQLGRQGRRQPRRGQRRVRQAHQAAELRRALRRAVRHLARLHVRQRPRGHARSHSAPGSTNSSGGSPRRPRCCPSTAPPTYPNQRGAENEHDDRGRIHPPPTRRPLWRRLIGFNLLSAVILGVGGYYLGWFIGHQVNGGKSFEYQAATDENDVALLLAYFFGVIGFLIGLGFANYPLSRLLGRPASLREKEGEGIGRYFGLCTDHKVVGMQYLVGIGVFFFVGGLNAMLIRTELLHPVPDVRGAQPVPVAGGHARHDDDGDDDLWHPRPVRQLLRADHDRRPTHGLPPHRGAHLLAADGRRLHPRPRRSSSAASPRAGPAMRR